MKKLEFSPEFVFGVIEWLILFILWKETSDFSFVLMNKILFTIFNEVEFYEELLLSPKRIVWNLLSLISYIIAFSIMESGYMGVSLWISFHTIITGIILVKIGSFHSKSRWNYVRW